MSMEKKKSKAEKINALEKFCKMVYPNPEVTMKQSEYESLTDLAYMSYNKVHQLAKELYEKNGRIKINFSAQFIARGLGEDYVECDEFEADCAMYDVNVVKDGEKFLLLSNEMRQRIARKVERYVEGVFEGKYGERMKQINYIKQIKAKAERERRKFLVWTVTGWILAVVIMIICLIA